LKSHDSTANHRRAQGGLLARKCIITPLASSGSYFKLWQLWQLWQSWQFRYLPTTGLTSIEPV
jgi:hypothetical protein